jgi:hypothetical protein
LNSNTMRSFSSEIDKTAGRFSFNFAKSVKNLGKPKGKPFKDRSIEAGKNLLDGLTMGGLAIGGAAVGGSMLYHECPANNKRYGP